MSTINATKSSLVLILTKIALLSDDFAATRTEIVTPARPRRFRGIALSSDLISTALAGLIRVREPYAS
jgi:hypothetical protein